ncbi:MAG: AMP-binding protein, partial [Methanobacteriaceae archaeon]|nr:AMP-binding protein [Methanobacteriaceae archaeon]
IKDEDADIKEEDVLDYSISKIARYKVPKHVFFNDELPLTASGKVQKFILRDMAVEFLNKKIAEEENLD